MAHKREALRRWTPYGSANVCMATTSTPFSPIIHHHANSASSIWPDYLARTTAPYQHNSTCPTVQLPIVAPSPGHHFTPTTSCVALICARVSEKRHLKREPKNGAFYTGPLHPPSAPSSTLPVHALHSRLHLLPARIDPLHPLKGPSYILQHTARINQLTTRPSRFPSSVTFCLPSPSPPSSSHLASWRLWTRVHSLPRIQHITPSRDRTSHLYQRPSNLRHQTSSAGSPSGPSSCALREFGHGSFRRTPLPTRSSSPC